jgi:tetratricopeptide (TPR) repeat protein
MSRDKELEVVRDAIRGFDLDTAESQLAPLITMRRDGEALLLRAQIDRVRGDYDSAKKAIKQGLLLKTEHSVDFRAERALVLLGEGKLNKAIVVAKRILDGAPENETAIRAYVACLWREQQYDEAMTILDAALQGDGDNPVYLGEKAAILSSWRGERQDKEKAWECIRKAVKSKGYPETAITTAVSEFFEGSRGEEVRKMIADQIAASPRNFGAVAEFSKFHWNRREYTAARDRAREATAMNPLLSSAWDLEILALEGLKDWQGVRAAASAASASLPRNAEFKLRVITLALADDDIDAASEMLKEFERVIGRTADWWQGHLACLLLQGDLDGSITAAIEARAFASRHPNLQTMIGSIFAGNGQFDAAQQYLERQEMTEIVAANRVLVSIIQGDFEEAERLSDEAQAHYGGNAAVLAFAAWLLGRKTKFEDAEKLLKRAESIDPKSDEPVVVRVELLLMQSRIDEARALVDCEIPARPWSIDLHVSLAHILLISKKFDEAILAAEKVIGRNRPLTVPIQIKALALQKRGSPAEALQLIADAMKRIPHSVGLRACRGHLQLLCDEYPTKAELDLRWVVENASAGLMARTGLGAIAYQSRDYHSAEKWFRGVRELQPFSAEAATNLAWTLAASGTDEKLREGETLCQGVLTSHPRDTRATACLAAIAHRRGDRRKAEWLLASVAGEEQDDPEVLVNYGAAQARIGKYDDAEATLRRALKITGNHARGLVELATLLTKQKRFDDARKFARAGVDSNPRLAAPWRAMALLAIAEGQPKNAEEYLRRGLASVVPVEATELRIELARLLLNTAAPGPTDPRLRDAIENLQQVLRVTPDAADALLLRGIAALRLGRPGEAIDYCRRVTDPKLQGYVAGIEAMAREMVGDIRQHLGPVEQYGLFSIFLIQMVLIWFFRDKLPAGAFATLLTVTCALLIVALLLPRLTSIKIATVEAAMTLPPREYRSETVIGPAGDIEMTPSLDLIVGALSYDT